jgi:ABC-type enterochelin transport system permease subunit
MTFFGGTMYFLQGYTEYNVFACTMYYVLQNLLSSAGFILIYVFNMISTVGMWALQDLASILYNRRYTYLFLSTL